MGLPTRFRSRLSALLAASLAVAPLALVPLVLVLSGCSFAPGYPPQPPPRPDQIESFTTLYAENCAACHGADGQNGPAIDLANPEYLALVDDASLRKWIAEGKTGTQMPAFAQSAGGMLTDAQIDTIVAGMRKQWSKPNAFGGATPPPYDQSKAGDAQRGQQAYKTRCAICHESSPQQLTSPVYLALVSDQSLRTVIIAGRPDIGQPDWRHDAPNGQSAPPLSPSDLDDLVTYLGTLRSGTPSLGVPPASPPNGRSTK